MQIALDHECYPENLLRFSDAPEILYLKGSIVPEDRLAVAVVGTRDATEVGKRVSYELSRDMAGAGVTVVSGLAAGIDAAAHRGALKAGGRTLACLGCGTDVRYPAENSALYERIPESGALLSEYRLGTRPRAWHFPQRNRIIAMLSLGVVVIEAGENSGALITARLALSLGIPVMAVPGSVKSKRCAGSNKLIQEGAYLVTSALDVLSFLRRENEYVPLPDAPLGGGERRQLSFEESLVLAEIDGNALSLDALAERLTNLSPGRVAAALSSLEVDGIVLRLAGGKYLANTGQATIGKGQ